MYAGLSQYYALAASPPVGDTAMVASLPMQQMQQKLPSDRLEVSITLHWSQRSETIRGHGG